ncbi:MAG: terminase [Eubacteriales bacterium]|nr:terminase [Eubacteriales bacterium]
MAEKFLLSPKYKAFLRCDAPVEFLEGTTYAGKTTVGIFKFMLKVRESHKKQHIIAGLDLGTIEKNIINKDLGIVDIFGDLVKYNSSGRGGENLPHLSYQGKIIYALGYADKARWKKALGSQSGCIYIDEINIADMDFVREASMRCDYLMATLNPDDPSLPVYEEYINHSRPLPEYEKDAPDELNQMLTEEPKPGWVHWFFSFEHNAGLTPEKQAQIIGNVPVGTKLYKNKIQGLRGRSTGLIFNLRPENIITPKQAKEFKFNLFSCGVDTSYSRESDDTFTFSFTGLTICRKKITLAEKVYNNKDRTEPITPSDVPPLLVKFLEQCRSDWGFGRNVFIDSADQGTILECQKYKRAHGSPYMFQGAWKKTTIIDRINFDSGWLAHGDSLIVDTCKEHIRERNLYSWKENKDEPEDRNDHSVNSDQYSWLPFKDRIGNITKEAKG